MNGPEVLLTLSLSLSLGCNAPSPACHHLPSKLLGFDVAIPAVVLPARASGISQLPAVTLTYRGLSP